MSIESDADKDLQISDEDADAVVGGHKKKEKKHGTREAGSTIPSSFGASPTGNVASPDSSGDGGYLTGQ